VNRSQDCSRRGEELYHSVQTEVKKRGFKGGLKAAPPPQLKPETSDQKVPHYDVTPARPAAGHRLTSNVKGLTVHQRPLDLLIHKGLNVNMQMLRF